VTRLDQREDGNDIQDYLYKKTGQRTVPNIFISTYMCTLVIDCGRMLTGALQTKSILAAPRTSLMPKPLADFPSLSQRKNINS
jgi:hypothetical protein